MNGKMYLVARAFPETTKEGEKTVCFDPATGKILWESIHNVFLSDAPAERVGWVSPVCDPETSTVVAPPGAPLTAVLDTLRSDLRFPTYSLSYEGVEVARTSEDFARRLVRRVGSIERGRRHWPRLSGLTVESYETRVTDSAGIDQHDITQAARVTGMADLQWKKGEH